MAYHRHVPQTLITVVLLLVSVSNLGVQLVSASPIPFSEARLKEIDEMRARGVSETELIALNPIIDTQKPLVAPLPPTSSSSSQPSSSAWFSRDGTSQVKGSGDDTTDKRWYQELYTQFRHLIADATPRRLMGAGNRKSASKSPESGDNTLSLSAASTHLQNDNPTVGATEDPDNVKADINHHVITAPHHPINADEEADIGAHEQDEEAEGEDDWRQQRLISISKERQILRLVAQEEDEREDEEIQRERMKALSSSSSSPSSTPSRQVEMVVKAEVGREGEEQEQEEAEGMFVTGRMGSGNLKVRRLL